MKSFDVNHDDRKMFLHKMSVIGNLSQGKLFIQMT